MFLSAPGAYQSHLVEARQEGHDAPIAVSAELTEYQFCKADEELMFVATTLRLTFRNRSQAAVLLDPGGIRIFQTAVARTVEELESNKAQSIMDPFEIVESVDVNPEKLWMILPGETRALTRHANFLMARPGVELSGIAGARAVIYFRFD